MPAYKDTNGTWFCKFYYQDFTGELKQKFKRGFNLKREAEEWERSFLHQRAGSPQMTFQAACDAYLEDKHINLKEKSWYDKKSRLEARRDYSGSHSSVGEYAQKINKLKGNATFICVFAASRDGMFCSVQFCSQIL